MKKAAVAKFLEKVGPKVDGQDSADRFDLCVALENEFDYTIRCDENNNGPAERNLEQLVVDVWEDDPEGKYTRFVLHNGDVTHHDKP